MIDSISWAEDAAIWREVIEDALSTGVHVDRDWKEVDVREIDSRYATNLYNWYLKKFPKERHDEVKNSILFRRLESSIKGE